MCRRRYVSKNDPLEVATRDAVVINKHVIAVLCQVLENSECPRNVGAAITEKNTFFDAFHIGSMAAHHRPEPNDTRKRAFMLCGLQRVKFGHVGP
jgi:hypothetical protein